MRAILLAAVLLFPTVASAEKLAGLEASPFFQEQVRLWKTHQARVLLNAAGDFDSKKPTLLIIYALPNGNTIEQTMGAQMRPGMDWHFDIQHIAAQVRLLRSVERERNVVLAYVESDEKSWPAYRRTRPGNGRIIRSLVQEIAQHITGEVRIALAGHSGGGSFIFAYLNGGEAIREDIERIAFIDATYGYNETDRHAEKLLAWLKGDAARHLVVFAYDDREVKLDGKNIVSPTGGTYYRSHQMIDRLRKDQPIDQATRGPFEAFAGMDGRIRMLLHTNPETKILHTVLVERNGLLEAMTLGTPLENKWGGEFWGDRAYSKWIQPAATTSTAPAPASKSNAAVIQSAKPQAAEIPPRAENAMGGKAFVETIADLPPAAREAAIVQEILRGNIPDFLREFHVVEVGDSVYEVMPDYLSIGSDEDFVRMPMTPVAAQAIANAFGLSLPTRKMVDDVYRQAQVKLEPRPLTEQREAVRTFVQHNQIIESQRAGKPLGRLVAGHKKDIVITSRLREKPNKVAIYGWHKLDGKPIQPLYVGHAAFYVDYSHGVRLVKREVTIDGQSMRMSEVLSDPKLCERLSDEGVIDTAGLYE